MWRAGLLLHAGRFLVVVGKLEEHLLQGGLAERVLLDVQFRFGCKK